MKTSRIINLPKIGNLDTGFISLIEINDLLPFNPKRVYWTYEISKETKRGGHSHYNLEQVIICLNGSLEIILENIKGNQSKYILNNPRTALYIPSGYWRDIVFKKNTILLCIASEVYDENDYVRDYKKI